MSQNIKEIISKKIIENLEGFNGVWSQPWFLTQAHNPITGTKYRGVNLFTLGLLGKTGQFVTYKQAQENGGQVKKGAKSLPIVFYSPIEKENAQGEKDSFFMMRYYNVFDLADIEGMNEYRVIAGKNVIQPLCEANDLLDKTGAKIVNGSSAYYSPITDYISVPAMDRFTNQSAYYSTVFHELTHWTGHYSRLARFKQDYSTKFASHEYALEELVAELGSCMFLQHFGVLDPDIENSKAYLKNWWSKIKEKPTDLFDALQKAHKAYQFITKEGVTCD